MGSIRVKAELVLGEGEYLKIDKTVEICDAEIQITCLDPTGQTLEVSASSLLLTSDQPVITDILDGSPQTNVRLLVMLADPT